MAVEFLLPLILVAVLSVWLGRSRWNPLSPPVRAPVVEPIWPPESTLRTLSDCDGDDDDAER